MAEVQEQVVVGVREAAEIAGVSTKQVRKWINDHRVRAELRESKFGPTWFIEVSSLPLPRRPLERGIPGGGQGLPGPGEGPEGGMERAQAGAMQALLAMLADLQRRHEGAVARLGQLEGEREHRLALEERARSLVEREAQATANADAQRRRAEELVEAEARARQEVEAERLRVEEEQSRATELAAEAEGLRRSVRLRTWTAGISMAAAGLLLIALLVRLFGR